MVALIIASGIALAVAVSAGRPDLAPTVSRRLPVSTPGGTRFGAIVSTAHDPSVTNDLAGFITLYNAHRAQLGGGPLGVRVYSPNVVPIPDESPPTKAEQIMSWVAARHPDESMTVSFKLYDGARLANLLTWAQRHDVGITVIYFHEVQDDWGGDRNPRAEPGFYKSVYRLMRAVIDKHPWKAHVTLEKNLSWYWQQFKAPSLGADWREFVEPKSADGGKADPADRVTWDAYSPQEWYDRYATPADFMQFPLEVYTESAVGWGYGELGVQPQRRPADSAWVAAIRAYLDAARTPSLAGAAYANLPAAEVVRYWDAFTNDAVNSDDLSQNPGAVTMYAAYVSRMPLRG